MNAVTYELLVGILGIVFAYYIMSIVYDDILVPTVGVVATGLIVTVFMLYECYYNKYNSLACNTPDQVVDNIVWSLGGAVCIWLALGFSRMIARRLVKGGPGV